MDTKLHAAQAERTASASLMGNAGLALGKALAGGASGSPALLADAVRSAVEAASGSIALLGLRRRGRIAPSEALERMRKAELAAMILVTVVLMVIGLELAVSSFRLLADGLPEAPHWSALAVAAGALLVKRWLLRLPESLPSLLASLITLLGIGAAYAGELSGQAALYYCDPAAGVLVAVLVMYSAYRLLASSVILAPAEQEHQEDTEEFMQFVQRIEGVITIEELHAREHGHYVRLNLRISVNPRISVYEGQEIAKRVKELVLKRFIHVSDVEVVVDPYDPGYPYKSNHDPNQEDAPTLLQ
ncbi:cation diffusion facilitator family transporter [Paenibacillus sp. SYP-B4298]|uniref:cation diffusion facilitator family transporter n=1 Tax=Paenibacillus sp. SYP-B4298 TaxID=2996034 RepID=UPI0022DD008E|nr:cation diffusion facilitator family transporter [Paenibacillus sp. SYP-B4298]